MPRKEFEAFTRLDASDVNTYLMDQSVQTFADSTARGSAIGTATEGMVTYLEDTNSVQVWDGSSWGLVGGTLSRNYVLNSNMTVLQRGTSNVAFGATTYAADQWRVGRSGSVAGATWSLNTPTSNTGFKNATNIIRDSGGTATATLNLTQPFETAGIELRGKTVTLSFYAIKGNTYSATNSELSFGYQSSSVAPESIVYNTGGIFNSGNADLSTGTETVELQSSWTRHSATFTIPTTANAFQIWFTFTPVGTAGANDFYRITGVQLEEGPVATTYKPNGSSYVQELASCQRYYYRIQATGVSDRFASGFCASSTTGDFIQHFPVTMRSAPAALETTGTAGNYSMRVLTTQFVAAAVPVYVTATTDTASYTMACSPGVLTGGQGGHLRAASSAAYLAWSAEL